MSMTLGHRQSLIHHNERVENLRKRIELESIKGLNQDVIDESENESESEDITSLHQDNELFEKLEQNFRNSEFYLE